MRPYWLAILVTAQRHDRVLELRLSLDRIRSRFGEFHPRISLLGEEQQDSPLFTAADSYVVYAQSEHG